MKYYTPTIEDIVFGLEYEIKTDEKWESKICDLCFFMPDIGHITTKNDNGIEGMMYYLSVNDIRVKHLDREDIESFGWEYSDDSWGYLGEAYTGEFEVEILGGVAKSVHSFRLIHPNVGMMIIETKQLYTIGGLTGPDDRWITVARLTIKNKSEFKRILTQIGVI